MVKHAYVTEYEQNTNELKMLNCNWSKWLCTGIKTPANWSCSSKTSDSIKQSCSFLLLLNLAFYWWSFFCVALNLSLSELTICGTNQKCSVTQGWINLPTSMRTVSPVEFCCSSYSHIAASYFVFSCAVFSCHSIS